MFDPFIIIHVAQAMIRRRKKIAEADWIFRRASPKTAPSRPIGLPTTGTSFFVLAGFFLLITALVWTSERQGGGRASVYLVFLAPTLLLALAGAFCRLRFLRERRAFCDVLEDVFQLDDTAITHGVKSAAFVFPTVCERHDSPSLYFVAQNGANRKRPIVVAIAPSIRLATDPMNLSLMLLPWEAALLRVPIYFGARAQLDIEPISVRVTSDDEMYSGGAQIFRAPLHFHLDREPAIDGGKPLPLRHASSRVRSYFTAHLMSLEFKPPTPETPPSAPATRAMPWVTLWRPGQPPPDVSLLRRIVFSSPFEPLDIERLGAAPTASATEKTPAA